MKPPAPRALLALFVLANAAILAQATPRPDPQQPDPSRPIPIHTSPDVPGEPAYGLWTGGGNFKASFHDGFVFYAALGKTAPRNLPLRWSTESVRSGALVTQLPSTPPRPSHTEWRCEYRHQGFTEVYDVRAEGVEQSFVLTREIVGSGDFTIIGRVETEMLADPVAAAHQSLTFHDAEGRAVVAYGAATAIDAAGRKAPVTTSWDGERVELTVSGTWLAEAAWPVTVDPLTAAVSHYAAVTEVEYTDIAHDPESHEMLICYSRIFSASDRDVLGYLVDNALGSPFYTFSEISTLDYRQVQCCYVGGADRWVIACSYRTNSSATVRAHVLRRATYVLNSYTTWIMSPPVSGVYDHWPSVGGSFHATNGAYACVAWQRDLGGVDTDASVVWGATFNVTGPGATLSAAQRFRLDPGPSTLDQDYPCVNKASETGDWLVVYQEYDNTIAGDDWDIDAAVVIAGSGVYQNFRLGVDPSPSHKILPKISGSSGRYFYSYVDKPVDRKLTSAYGPRIVGQNFDWTGTLGRMSNVQTVWSGADVTTGTCPRPIAFDYKTFSHAVVGGHSLGGKTFVTRVGIENSPVESAELAPGEFGYSVGTAYNSDTFAFATSYAIYGIAIREVRARGFLYPAARAVPYGIGCAGTVGAYNSNMPANLAAPYRGSSGFGLVFTACRMNRDYVPVLGVGASNLDLGRGCTLLVDPFLPNTMLPAFRTSNLGTALLPLAIPAAIVGDVNFQALALENGEIIATRAIRLEVR